MMKRLVIAEKPSVGKAIAAVLGAEKKCEGYLEGDEYIVSWCVGHLVELGGPESYDERFVRWKREDLPIVPVVWKYKVSHDKYRQFMTLKQLMNRSDVSEVVNACDAGREGELIFRNMYTMAKCSKPVLRLWISSMEDTAIEQGFRDLKPGSEYDRLYAAAVCRDRADWLVGINATRLFSVLYHRTLNVGRVVSPTLALLVQREAAIGAFKPEPFYTVILEFDSFSASSAKFRDKAEAEKCAEECHKTVAKITNIDRKEKSEKAPALYDLTTLQREANRIHGYTAQQTLDYVQSLYEKKLCTYPRTDSRYLPEDMESSIKAIVLCAAGIAGMDVPPVAMTNQVCDSTKVSDHHAIIPTMVAGETDISGLPAGERDVLLMIAKQVLKAAAEAHRYEETVVTMTCGGTEFAARGKRVSSMGWKAYVQMEHVNALPDDLEVGRVLIPGEERIKDGVTVPPKHFTEDTLLSAMENAGGADMPDDAERKGLGTPATRASIIEKLVSAGFVDRKKTKKSASLIPANVGVSLITILPEQLKSPLLTAEWEHRLKMVERGELDVEAFLSEIALMVDDLVRTYKIINGAEVLFPSGREAVGKCPRCGGEVTESKKGFFCERNDCRFGLWRDNKFLAARRINLTKPMVAALLKDAKCPVKGIFSEKTGKSCDAVLVLVDDGTKSVYSLDFGKKQRE
jgi:DNA topoisomerase-3